MKYYILKTFYSHHNKYEEVYVTYSGCMQSFGLINYSSSCHWRKNAIKVSDEVLNCDILKIYMSFHDCIIEEVNLNEESSRNVFHTLNDYGNKVQMDYYYNYFAEQGQNYVIAPSEQRVLNGAHLSFLYYKIQSKIDDNIVWLDSNMNWNNNENYAMIISEHCLHNIPLRNFLKKTGVHHCYHSVQLPSHFSKIFYLAEDMGNYCSIVNQSK